jgi:hypothetical protein
VQLQAIHLIVRTAMIGNAGTNNIVNKISLFPSYRFLRLAKKGIALELKLLKENDF